MYNDTITLFNKLDSKDGDTWYSTIIESVDLNIDRASILREYGSDSTDTAILHVRYTPDGYNVKVAEKLYVLPKQWKALDAESRNDCLTFGIGDFVFLGEYVNPIINDDDYQTSFYDFMKKKYDHVYAITSVSKYDCIPHFEIMCK